MRIDINTTNSIENGDTSNNTTLTLPTHFATHIDYPYHFSTTGKKGHEFNPNDFISNKIQLIDKSNIFTANYYFTINDFCNIDFISNTEILILKTGIGKYINEDIYWKANPGICPKLAKYFKSKMPNIRFFGFDSISLTGRKYRKEGKAAHSEFLLKNNILILEDMDLNCLSSKSLIKKIIIAPLRFMNADGAPTTIFAKIYEKSN